MGSAFSQNSKGLDVVMRVLRTRSLYFVDSKTSPGRIAENSAAKYQLPFITRDIFLDNAKNEKYIKKQLFKAVKISKKHGVAVVIGHPYPVTYHTLAKYLPVIEKTGIRIIKVSELLP